MGQWGPGLMEGDDPVRIKEELVDGLHEDLSDHLSEPASETGVAELGCLAGLLLKFSPASFQGPFFETIRSAIEHERALLGKLPMDAAWARDAISKGGAANLLERSIPREPQIIQVLGEMWKQDCHQPMLFTHKDAAAYLQLFADSCVTTLDEGLDPEVSPYGTEVLAALGLLLVIPPCKVDRDHIETWRQQLQEACSKGVEMLQDCGEMENLERFKAYMKNAGQAIQLLRVRCGLSN
jgi:hypothetical protein